MAVLNEARIMIMLPTETIHHAGLSALPGHDAAGTAHRPKGTAEHALLRTLIHPFDAVQLDSHSEARSDEAETSFAKSPP
ncbi:MAG: hypothetical protein WBF07_22020 [Xanthobacteraceae bacterium]